MAIKVNVEKIAQLTGHNSGIYSLTHSELPYQFLSGAGDGWIVQWDLSNPEMGRLLAKVETQIYSLLSIPDYQLIVAGNMNGGIHWVNIEDDALSKNIAHHQRGVFDLLRVDDKLFSLGGVGLITRWSIPQASSEFSYQLTNQSLRSISYSADRRELAIGASDHAIYLLDATTFVLKKTILNAHQNSVFTVQYHPNGRYLLSGGRDAMLKVWDLEDDYRLWSEQPAHWFTINHIVFHPSGKLFATASRDKTLKIWDGEDFKLLKVLETIRDQGHLNSVNHLFWSEYQDYLVSCSDDRSMIVWKVTINK